MFASRARNPEDPRVIVGDGPFAACWDGKAWSVGTGVKSLDEFTSDFIALSDSEAFKLVRDARTALSTKFGQEPTISQRAAKDSSKADQDEIASEKKRSSIEGVNTPVDQAKISAQTHADRSEAEGRVPNVKYSASDDARFVFFGMRLLAFVVGFSVIFLAEAVLLHWIGEATHRRIMPRGLGWIVIPIFGGMFCWAAVPQSNSDFQILWNKCQDLLSRQTPFVRWCSACVLIWLAAVATFFLVMDPFGRYVSNEEWSELVRLLTLPPIIGVIVAWLVAKLVGDRL